MLGDIRHQTGLLDYLYWIVLTDVDSSFCLCDWSGLLRCVRRSAHQKHFGSYRAIVSGLMYRLYILLKHTIKSTIT
jgi:hypothetical protein